MDPSATRNPGTTPADAARDVGARGAAIMAAVGAVVGASLWGSPTRDLAQFLVVLPAVYLATAAGGGPRSAWLHVAVLTTAFLVAPVASLEPAVAVAGLALLITAVRLPRRAGRAHQRTLRHELRRQAAGAVVFVAVAVVAFLGHGPTTGLLLAAGWAAHAAWDAYHLHAQRLVARSYAAWCGTLDLVVAAGLVVGTLA